ncbi:MAG: ABC transporter transmembrane domain-containing protein [Oscillospiraceae bacterium]
MLFSELLAIAMPFLSSKVFYDSVLREGQPLYGQVLFVASLVALTGLLSALSMMLYGILISKLNMQAMHDLRVSAFSSMQRLSLGFFISKRTGSLMTRIDNDVDSICWFFADVVPQTLAKSVTARHHQHYIFNHAGLCWPCWRFPPRLWSFYVFSNKFQVKYFRPPRGHAQTQQHGGNALSSASSRRSRARSVKKNGSAASTATCGAPIWSATFSLPKPTPPSTIPTSLPAR